MNVAAVSDSKKSTSNHSFTDLTPEIQQRLAKPSTLLIVDKENVTETITEEKCPDQNATVIFRKLKNCTFTLDARCTKIMFEYCENSTIVLNNKVITAVGEVWRCTGCTIKCNTSMKAFQMDHCSDMTLGYSKRENFHQVVWAACNRFHVLFDDISGSNMTVGMEEMKKIHPDVKEDVDQFIMRFVGGKLLCELIVRLENGFPTTEREAAEWDREQEARVQQLAKDAGITISKKKTEVKVGRNDPCTCGSGKKFKNCCINKPTETKLIPSSQLAAAGSSSSTSTTTAKK